MMPKPMGSCLISYLKMHRPISESDQLLINEAFETRSYKPGDYLFHPDHTCKELFFICKGILRIVVLNEKGNELTYFFLKENQFCTILNSFNGQIVTKEGIQAASAAEVLAISRSNLLSLYQKVPYLKELIDKITQAALLDKIQLKNSYIGLDSTERYKLFTTQQADITMRVSLGDIASYLGITRQSLSRIRKNVR
jgi:CRP-like cAMP-binding protein